MRPRQPVLWLMTDERMGEALWDALARLPRGAGVVFRHYQTPLPERRRLWAKAARVAKARGLVLVRAGPVRLGRGDAGTHGRRGSLTWPAHDRRQAIAGLRAGAKVLLVSPVCSTRSHPGRPALGLRAGGVGRGLPVSRIALGGMDVRRFRRIKALGFDGWAAIDAWTAQGAQADGGSHNSTAFPSGS